eukprot:1933469-Rhodomonas_salina.1
MTCPLPCPLKCPLKCPLNFPLLSVETAAPSGASRNTAGANWVEPNPISMAVTDGLLVCTAPISNPARAAPTPIERRGRDQPKWSETFSHTSRAERFNDGLSLAGWWLHVDGRSADRVMDPCRCVMDPCRCVRHLDQASLDEC